MKQLKNPKFIIIAAGILISVAFYFLKGPGSEVLAVSATTEELSSSQLPMGAETTEELPSSQLPMEAVLTEEQLTALSDLVRKAVREELAACCEEGYLESALAAGVQQAAEAAEKRAGMIDLNTAGKSELMQLEGIGEKRAQDIIDYRERAGGFTSIEEIMQVKGIKESAFERIRAKIYV